MDRVRAISMRCWMFSPGRRAWASASVWVVWSKSPWENSKARTSTCRATWSPANIAAWPAWTSGRRNGRSATTRAPNGLFVNGHRVEFKELNDGDVIRVGQYELKYGHVEEELRAVAPAPPPTSHVKIRRVSDGARAVAFAPGTGIICPSCKTEYPAKSKICVSCGVKLDTGRPVLLSAGTDEDYVHGTAETMIRWVSWLVWVTPLPMPLASEAFGRHKPWAIRAIAAVSVASSMSS